MNEDGLAAHEDPLAWYEPSLARLSSEIAFCVYCKSIRVDTVTKLCDRCWELERRIDLDFFLAQRILEVVRERRYLRYLRDEVVEFWNEQ